MDAWVNKQEGLSLKYLFDNISPKGSAPGSILASPSKIDPDYYYHWVRDAALVMEVVIDLYRKETDPAKKAAYDKQIVDYVSFSRRNQLTDNPSGTAASGGLGEPKFHADGLAYLGNWGRPQNDGPGLRATTLSRLAHLWLGEGREALVREKLYRPGLPAETIIKADLEFVSHHWRESSFDIWEEIRGDHFYTRMVQRKSLLEGARLATTLGDPLAADWYTKQAKLIEATLLLHWDEGKGVLVPTLNRTGGVDYKVSGLDSAIILAVLHGNSGDTVFAANDPKVLATALKLEEEFIKLYPINQKGIAAVAIGRYPEDRYTGYSVSAKGNPWVLLTAAFAEVYLKAAERFEKEGRIEITPVNFRFFQKLGLSEVKESQLLSPTDAGFPVAVQKLRARADEFLDRIRVHAGESGRLSEQLNKETGAMESAENLTWSYAAFLTAAQGRRG